MSCFSEECRGSSAQGKLTYILVEIDKFGRENDIQHWCKIDK
jgi:hypothetical protein